jgi:hypothetical protein
VTDNWSENKRGFQPRRKKPVQQQQQEQARPNDELADLKRRVTRLEDLIAMYPNPPGTGD